MDKEIKKMKLKLTLLSVFLIGVIIFIFGSSFLGYKYFQVHENTIKKIKDYENNLKVLDLSGVTNLKNDNKYKFLFNNFFILTDNSGNIIYNNSEFLDEKETGKLLGFKGKNKEFREDRGPKNFEDDGYFINNYKFENNYRLITMFYLSYSLEQLFYDLIIFFLVILFFSIILTYFIYKFISYILKPIEENFKSMKYFVQVAGHELKTPISVISSGIQLLNQTKIYDQEVVDDIKNELEKSDNLTNGLIDLYNISELSNKKEIRVSDIIYEVVKNLKTISQSKNIGVKIDFKNEILVQANRYYVYMLVFNLVSNAIKYSNINSEIQIVIDKNILIIKDNGIGIEKKEHQKIFDIFYRVSNHRNIEGFGLGLSIVKKIIDIYNWKILLDSEVGKGSEFTIIFK